jgi:hypothetical protein
MTPPAEEKAMVTCPKCGGTSAVYCENGYPYCAKKGCCTMMTDTEIRPIHAAIPDGEVDEIRDTVRQAREYMKANGWNPNNRGCELMTELCSCSEQAAARLTALEAENAALEAKIKAQQSHIQLHAGDCLSLDNEVNLMRSHWEEEMAENAALKAEVAEARAKAMEECAKTAETTEVGYSALHGRQRIATAIRSLSTSQGKQGR